MTDPHSQPPGDLSALPAAPAPATQETQAYHAAGPATDPAAPAPPVDPAAVPAKIGAYEVRRLLGVGGMGRVYEAFDPVLQRPVALKVMSPALLGNPVTRARFQREARAAALVEHENIITIYGVDEDAAVLVLQYVPGPTLHEVLHRDGPRPIAEVVRIGKEVAAGLAAAHAKGLVHRDIKPGNILLEDGTGRAKITDFGLARAVDDPALSQAGVVLGTPQFMAPEQARGEELDARADLFSLGGVLYAMCTARPPFVAPNTMATLRKVCDEQPEPIRAVRPEVPRWLEAVVERLMAKDRAARYPTAEDLIAALERGPGAGQEGVTPEVPRAVVTLEPAEPAGRPLPRVRKGAGAGWAVPLIVGAVVGGLLVVAACGGMGLLAAGWVLMAEPADGLQKQYERATPVDEGPGDAQRNEMREVKDKPPPKQPDPPSRKPEK